jgi:hypothetical protein
MKQDEAKTADYVGYALLCVLILGALLFALSSVGCSNLKDKSVGVAGTISAVKIETSGGSNTGTPMPNILMGGSAFAFADKPQTDTSPIYVRAARTSFLSQIFRLGMDDSAMIYIGTPGETAEQTDARLKALNEADK